MVQRIFFDFGGCIDAPGIHTRTLFWEAFLAEALQKPEDRAIFQEAYTSADQRMMASGEAAKLDLAAFNRWNSLLIAQPLKIDEASAARAGDRVTVLMRSYLASSRLALLEYKKQFRLSVISNFTGNLEVILREFSLRELFDSVTESYYAGASKPDLRIFQAALAKHEEKPAQCLYIGDNPVNDIVPAKALGLKTALIHPQGQRKDCGADYYGESLLALLSLIQSR